MTYIAGKLLEWERFWAPWDPKKGVVVDSVEFLNDPRILSWNSNADSLKSTSELANYRCLVLLGDPGMGKTTSLVPLMQSIRSSSADASSIFEIHCRDVPDIPTFRDRTYGNPRWKVLRDEDREIVLVVDGVDEGLRKVPEFVGSLADAMKDEPIKRLRVILACRTSEWDAPAGERLLALWGAEKELCAVYELKRLRWRDASMAAEACLEKRAETFMQTVGMRGLEALAARPLTLRLLIEDYDSRGELASNRRELYMNAIARMTDEWDESRRRRLKGKVRELPPTHVVAIVQRIAGLLLICGRSAVSCSKHAAKENDLSIDDIAGDYHVRSSQDPEVMEAFSASQDDVLEVLNGALFSTRGADRFGFDHPTFGELLAAEFLASFELQQARRLLCVEFRSQERIIPQLAETAAWLALARSDWAEELLRIDPEVLLRTDVPFLPKDLKRRLVEMLLDRASRLETLDHYDLYRRCRGLAYPELETQLRPWIEDESREFNARRLAIEIAGMAPAPKLEPLLWELVDSTGPKQGRSEAMRALYNLAGKHSRKQLQRVLEGSIPAGAKYEAIALALKAGVPEGWPVRAVLRWLRKPGDDWIGGDYETILDYHLPAAMTQQDVVPVLNNLWDWPGCFDGTSPFSGLAYRALSMALASPQTPSIRKALATMWAYRVKEHYSLPHTDFSEWQLQYSHRSNEQILRGQEQRRCLASILIEAAGFSTDHIWTHEPQLLGVKDLGWALEQTLSTRPKHRKSWTAVVLGLAIRAAQIEAEKPESKVLTAYDSDVNAVLALRGVEAFMDNARVTPKAGLTMTCVRRERVQILRRERRFKRRIQTPASTTETIKLRITCYRLQQMPLIWAEIGQRVYFKRDWSWEVLPAAELKTAKECARNFLLTYSDCGRPPDRFNAITFAAYEAILLLRDDVSNDARLKRAITDKWMFALHDTLDSDRNQHREVIAWAYRLAPKKMIEALTRRLRHYDQPDGYDHATQNFEQCWDARLTRTVLAFVVTARNGSLVESCAEHLMKLDQPAAEKWLKLQLSGIRQLGKKRDRSNAVVVSVLNWLHGAIWDKAWTILHRSSVPNRKAFLHRLAERRMDRDNRLQDLSAHQLGQMFQEIALLFSKDNGGNDHAAPESTGNEEVDDQIAASVLRQTKDRSTSDISMLRSDIAGKLAESGTEEALDELARLQRELPHEFLSLAYYAKDCAQKHLSILASERRPSSGDILKLQRIAATRWVESERELFEVVQASIKRFQSALTAGTDLISPEYLWNKGAPKDEDVFSKMLAAWLKKELRGTIVNRETQVESVGGGRLDIKIQAVPRRGTTGAIATTVIEVKRCSHPKARSALQSQLVDGYMNRGNIHYGIHLVAWFGYKSVKDARWITLEDAQSAADRWIEQISLPAGFSASCIIVDCHRTAVVPSRMV